MPTSLFLSDVAASFGARPLFAHLDLTVAPGDVVALVGPNGSGKSTLLRMIAGEHPTEAGDIRTAPAFATIGYLPQSVPDGEETIADYVRRRTGVAAATVRYEAATAALAAGEPGADDEFADALERWLALGGADLDARLGEVLARVGLAADPEQRLGQLSGGQAARASLVSVLLSSFDVLLLDEPTNNLDADGIAMLTNFVRGCQVPVLIASHDRAFMDAVVTRVCELDLAQQKINHYTGTWSQYREAKVVARRQQIEAHDEFQAQQAALEQFARRQEGYAGKARAAAHKEAHDPHHHGKIDWTIVEAGAKKQEQRAARARRAAKRLDEPDDLRKEWQLRYSIAQAPAPADVVLTLDDVVAAAGEFAVGPVSTHVTVGQRVALLGANGSGKTTLLRAVLAETAEQGRISWGARTSLGLLDQDRSVISGSGQLLDVVMAAIGTDDAVETRTLLAKFGVGAEHVLRPCDTLSLGERTRTAMAVLQAHAVNVLILDEPTNHADLEAIEQLQLALEEFGGAIIVVTHDHALLDALAVDVMWRFTRSGERSQVVVERR